MMQNHSLIMTWIVCCLSVSIGVCSAQAGAADVYPQPSLMAMADIGAIKNDLSPTDPAANVTWAELTAQQRTVLTPLKSEWDTLRPWQREKMLDIAKEYPKMDAQKQQRIQRQLVKWSRMTPYERENARKRYQQFQSLSPEKKDELRRQWKEHKQKAAASEGYDPEYDGAEP
ncbi:Protein of unknown function [Methylophilus rhizosphaerae]|uniref:DUF3106 domain-containing protein n=2 Tax=Methylophilus rhizosphaerae TaxID=492660 RepID=A0A1G9CIG5_9PROT|nr:Protein of unknown function [Methylophilus rhizosphaerae]